MGINVNDFRQYIVVPALSDLGHEFSQPVAVQLLLATAAQETNMGSRLHQESGGPALGIFEMQPATYRDVLVRAPQRDQRLTAVLGADDLDRLIYDLRYATVMARLKYWLWPFPLPTTDAVDALWAYYKAAWNSEEGKATQIEFTANYRRYVLGG